MTFQKSHTRWVSRCKTDPTNHKDKTFYLRDYLSPGGSYPYEELWNDLEDCRAAGNHVVLLSVPGFMMCSGYPDLEGKKPSKKPWYDDRSKAHATARQACSR